MLLFMIILSCKGATYILLACVYEEFTISVNRKNFYGKERERVCSEGYWSLNCYSLVTPNKNAKVNKRILFIYSGNIGHFEDGVLS